jgi:hypothetical protein
LRKLSLGGIGGNLGKELRTVKVSEETYKRLKWFKNMMELNALEGGEVVSFSMDTVISTMMDLLQSAKIRFAPSKREPQSGKGEGATQASR